MGGVGSYEQAGEQKIALGGQADTAKINAQMAEDGAQSAMTAGARQEQQTMIAAGNLKATQRADFAANGIDINAGGTPDRVIQSTDTMEKVDLNTENSNAVRAAFGFKMQGVNDLNQARTDTTAAGAINPLEVGATSLMNSAGSVAANWYKLQKSGW